MENRRGSEWRKWDLHVHTASSYDYKYKNPDADDKLIEALKSNGIQLVAITDHFVIDENRITNLRSKAPEIIFLPGVELRTDKGDTNIHVILIFDDNMNLHDLVEDFNSFKRSKGKNIDNYQKIYWDYSDIRDFSEQHDGIISIHAGSKDKGIDDRISNSLPTNEAVKEEYAKSVKIFEMGKPKDIEGYKKWVFPQIGNRPTIICSDNHNPTEYKSQLWVKADLSFLGLKQIIVEPDRIFIGEKPDILNKVQSNKTKYIDSLDINHVNDYKSIDTWFENVHIDFNPELVAIIGNKGSGKSAIADIIALCCNSNQSNYFSFLNDKKFRNKGLAKNFEASLKFHDGCTYSKNLFDSVSSESLPLIKYFPQGYFEDLCNNIEKNQDFNDEIEHIIFQYLDESDKLGCNSIQELINKKTATINEKIESLKTSLISINDSMIDLVKKNNPRYKIELDNKIQQKQNELKALVEPTKVEKPEDDNAESQKKSLAIEKLQKEISEITRDIALMEKKISGLKIQSQQISSIKDRIKNQESSIIQFTEQIKIELLSFNLDVANIIKYSIEYSNLDEKSNDIKKEIESLYNKVQEQNTNLSQKNIELEGLRKMLNEPQQRYQRYLAEYEEYKKQKKAIEGDVNSPLFDTLNGYTQERNYIQNSLLDDITRIHGKQIETSNQIINLKQEIIKIYSTIKDNIDIKIKENKDLLEDYCLEISTSLVVKNSFIGDFLSYVDQSRKGCFKGKQEGEKALMGLLSGIDMNDVKITELNGLWDSLINSLSDNNNGYYIDDQIKDLKKFYGYLFSLDYLDINYQLRQNGKDLSTLSPGERGALLLVFYLLLDTDNKPLILDQPEDNLDNNSVAKILVKFIRRAKKHRQIIMVTHNPNLAIVSDAEQIIKVDIDKNDKNSFHVESGSIEDSVINKSIVSILEGDMPAFRKRDDKYYE